MSKSIISIIVSCYNEEEAIPLFYNKITEVSKKFKNEEFEYIFVDDGSKDSTIDVIKKYANMDKRVRYISFSRNFGKEAAMFAGLEASTGDFVTFMDADLQDPPDLLPEMYKTIIDENYDMVGTRRVTRKGEPPIRSFFARMFYRIINKMSNIEMVDGARDYRLMTRKVADAVLSLKEYNRYSKGLFSFVGFKTKWIEFENVKRVAGETKWSFFKLFRYALDGIVAFSTSALSISSFLGLIFCLLAFILIILIICKTIIFGDPVGGWPSLVCIILFIGGIQLFCMGIMGQYIAKTYLEVKDRPLYIVKETEKDTIKG